MTPISDVPPTTSSPSGSSPGITLGAPFKPRDARPKILLDSSVEGEQVAGGLLPGFRFASGAHVILLALAPPGIPLVVPEVQVVVPVDPPNPKATSDSHSDPSFLPLFRGRFLVPDESFDRVCEC